MHTVLLPRVSNTVLGLCTGLLLLRRGFVDDVMLWITVGAVGLRAAAASLLSLSFLAA